MGLKQRCGCATIVFARVLNSSMKSKPHETGLNRGRYYGARFREELCYRGVPQADLNLLFVQVGLRQCLEL